MAASFSQLRPPSPLPPSLSLFPLAVVLRRRRDNYALSLMKIYRFCALLLLLLLLLLFGRPLPHGWALASLAVHHNGKKVARYSHRLQGRDLRNLFGTTLLFRSGGGAFLKSELRSGTQRSGGGGSGESAQSPPPPSRDSPPFCDRKFRAAALSFRFLAPAWSFLCNISIMRASCICSLISEKPASQGPDSMWGANSVTFDFQI